jgi:hypothetical protein
MVYSRNKLIHGDLVTKKEVRVNIWIRMQGLPEYIHLLKTEVLFFGSGAPRSLRYNEYFFPIERIIGFHLAPPAEERLDYDPEMANRTLLDVEMVLGRFLLKGKVLISTHTDFAAMLELSHSTWFSVYDADISNPFLPQMPTIHVAMLLVNPTQVSFGL